MYKEYNKEYSEKYNYSLLSVALGKIDLVSDKDYSTEISNKYKKEQFKIDGKILNLILDNIENEIIFKKGKDEPIYNNLEKITKDNIINIQELKENNKNKLIQIINKDDNPEKDIFLNNLFSNKTGGKKSKKIKSKKNKTRKVKK